MDQFINAKDIISSVIFSFFGFIMFVAAFFLFDKLTPGNLGEEIVEKKNVAAAIVIGSIAIGLAIIIGLAIH